MKQHTATVLDLDQGSNSEETSPVRSKIKSLLNDGAITQSQIARETGLTAPVISPWLKNRYAGDNQAVEKKLEQWLSSKEKKASVSNAFPAAPEWLDTPTGRKILNVMAYAQHAGDISVVYGGAGLGKTCTLEHYASENPQVWIACMSPAHGGVAAALEEIAEVVGLRGFPGRAARLHRELVRKFKGTGGLLIIDEAQHLNINAIEAIRALHDASGVGLALVGNESVYARLTGGSRTATFAQLFSRIGKRLRLTKPTDEDVYALADHFSISGKKERQALVEISQKEGALRSVVKTLRLATMFAVGEVQLDHIRAAWRDLGGNQ